MQQRIDCDVGCNLAKKMFCLFIDYPRKTEAKI